MVPQVYLSQESVDKLLANTNNHSELQLQLSLKQATNQAIADSTNAGNQAINNELNKLSQEAKKEAENKITEEDKNIATENTNNLITNNQEEYNKLVEKYLDSYKQEANNKITSKLGIATANVIDKETYIYVDPDSESKCKSGSFGACMTRFTTMTETQALDLAKQKAYDELYNNELNKIETEYYNKIYAETSNKFLENEAKEIYQTAYDNTYQSAYDTALAKAKEQNSAKMNTDSMITGDSVFIQGKSTDKQSTLNNTGTIFGNRQVVITTEQINNATSSMNFTNKDGTKTIADQATIMAGDLLYLNTTQYKTDDKGNYLLDEAGNKIAYSQGQVNNISGMIGTLNQDSTTYISTGTLNNITNSQTEEYSHNSKKASYEEIRTYVGTTSQITSSGNLIIDATDDINLIGAALLANNNTQITAGRDFNSTTVQDYNRTYSKVKTKDTFSSSTSIKENTSLKNIKSGVYTGDNITLITGNDITGIGTDFRADDGNINLVAGNDMTLINAMDFDYDYSYYKKESFDVGSAIANIAAAVAVGALTGGAGAAAMAGITAGAGTSQMTKGSVSIDMTYDEKTIANNLSGNNINITTGNNATMISTNLIAKDNNINNINNSNINSNNINIGNTNNSSNTSNINNINSNNNINLNIKNQLLINTAIEKHESMSEYNEWGGDITRAALGGAITGLAAGVGINGGEYLGNLAGSTVSNTLGTTVANATATAINTSTVAYVNTIGSTMSQVTISGGSLKDVLRSGRDTATDKNTLKNVAISGLTSGMTVGVTQYIDKATNGAVGAGNLKVNPNATLSKRFTTALSESAISSLTSTTIQSTINGDKFSEVLKNQLINTSVGALANIGAQEIGRQYHTNGFSTNNTINKATQLTLHAGLGAITSTLTGNDALSGAVSGVTGELFAELYVKSMYDMSSHGGYTLTDQQQNTLKELGGLAGGLSALITGKVSGLDSEDIASNVYNGQRIGKNAVENNYLLPHEKGDLLEKLKDCNRNKACENQVQAVYKIISDIKDEEFKKAYNDCNDNGKCEDLAKIHYDLRNKLTEEGNEYFWKHFGEFELLPNSKSVYHTFLKDPETGEVLTSGQDYNYLKYVHPIYGYEVVIDGNTIQIVTDPVNAGSYNFYNPSSENSLLGGFFLHKKLDVNPYGLLGNSPQDNTSSRNRSWLRIIDAYR